MSKKIKKKVSLAKFVALNGQTMAAARLGVTTKTLWMWAEKKSTPHGNNARRLDELGVTVG